MRCTLWSGDVRAPGHHPTPRLRMAKQGKPRSPETVDERSRNHRALNRISLSPWHGFTLIKQDLGGNILSEIPLGVHTGKWPFLFSDFSILKDKDGILITSPECDSVLRLSGNELFPVWRNFFKAKYGDELSEKKSLKVNMVNYSEDTILLSESISEYRGNTRFWGKVHLLLMDRSSNKLSVVKRLYFKENWFPINVLGLNLINNGKFAVVLQPADVDRILRSNLYRESVLNIMFPDSSAVSRSISDFDNQFVLLGKFR